MGNGTKKWICALLIAAVALLALPAVFAEGDAQAVIDVKWFCIDNSAGSKSLTSDMAVWKELGARNHMNIIIEAVPGSDLSQKFNLYLASGSALPDVMQSANLNDINRYGMEGAFVALDGLFADLAPNITAKLAADASLSASLTASDGHIYAISEYRPFPLTDPNPLIRVDWLERLGLSKPATLDEWYAVLKAFKEQDANGNGDPGDEIPFSGFFGGVGNFSEFFQAFGVMGEFYPDAQGNYQYNYTLPGMKDALAWLHQLYAEGLIDPDIASNDQTLFDQKFDSDTVGVFRGYFFTSMINKNKLAETAIPGLKLEAAPPLRGVDGEYHVMKTPVALSFYGVSASAQHPDRIVQLLDYIWSDDGILLTTMGIEGETFAYDDAGYPVYTDLILNNPEGLGAINALRTFGALNGMPYVHTVPYRIGLYPQSLRQNAQDTYDQHTEVAAYDSIVLSFTEDEIKANAARLTDIRTYASEMILKFVYGLEPIDKFDAFVDNVQNMGIDEVVKNHQAAYDRLTK
ncbi:MAG: extracellular solute-binding protein [Clostridiales bacterium]|nr:extracellular solute-binding protein [Clostridiales bacterium]